MALLKADGRPTRGEDLRLQFVTERLQRLRESQIVLTSREDGKWE